MKEILMVLLLTFVFKQGGTNTPQYASNTSEHKLRCAIKQILAAFMIRTKSQNITHGKIVMLGQMLHQPLIVEGPPLKIPQWAFTA